MASSYFQRNPIANRVRMQWGYSVGLWESEAATLLERTIVRPQTDGCIGKIQGWAVDASTGSFCDGAVGAVRLYRF